jgi:hypothetical protein
MIQRIFHPVGQGAFYSERHENYNIVYDCGCMSVSKGKKVVSQSFSKEDVIDILFISHFDYDHISLIEDLKTTVKEIRNVVIPLLHRNEKILLSNVFKALGEYSLASLVENPKEFFGAETHIIRVKPSSEEEINSKEETDKDTPSLSISLNNINKDLEEISSGTLIAIEENSDWVFIPFNYEYKDRNKEFLDKLESDEIDKLKSSKHIFDSEFRNKIKKTYKKVSGNINENTMFLYSGPTTKEKSNYPYLYWTNKLFCGFSSLEFYDIPFLEQNRVACLYTGDGDLNKTKVKDIYKKYWKLIKTIQIPHHGSPYSFVENILESSYFFCPISVGKNNSYGHPSAKVICKILSHKSYPIYVTEDVDSIFIEIIEKK